MADPPLRRSKRSTRGPVRGNYRAPSVETEDEAEEATQPFGATTSSPTNSPPRKKRKASKAKTAPAIAPADIDYDDEEDSEENSEGKELGDDDEEDIGLEDSQTHAKTSKRKRKGSGTKAPATREPKRIRRAKLLGGTGGINVNKNSVDSSMSEFFNRLLPVQVEDDPRMMNTRKMTALFDNITILRSPKATPMSVQSTFGELNNLKDMPKVSNRQMVADGTIRKDHDNWVAYVVDKNLPYIKRKSRASTSIHSISFTFNTKVYTKEQGIAATPILCRLLESWPHDLKSMNVTLRLKFVMTAVELLDAETPGGCKKYLSPIQYNSTAASPGYTTSIRIIDYGTGKIETKQLAVSPRLQIHRDPPVVPSNYIFAPIASFSGASKKKVGKDVSAIPSSVTPGSLEYEKHERAEKFIRYMGSQLDGRFMTTESFEAAEQYYYRRFGVVSAKTAHGSYGGKKLAKVFVDRTNRCRIIQPTVGVRKDFEGVSGSANNALRIYVKSLLRSRAAPGVEIMESVWASRGDIKGAILACCRAIDNENSAILDGDPPTCVCHCADHDRPQTYHVCAYCYLLNSCSDLARNTRGDLVCGLCTDTGEIDDVLRPRLKKCLNDLYKNDCRQFDQDYDEDHFNQTWSAIAQSLHDDGESWTDQYTNQVHLDQSSTSSTNERRPGDLNPFAASIDAIFPVDSIKWPTLQYHGPGNVGLTACYLNFAKATYPPGLLHIISESSKGLCTSAETLEALDRIHKIGLKLPWLKKQIAGSNAAGSAKAFANLIAEYITTRVMDFEVSESKLHRYTHVNLASPRVAWKPERIDTINEIIQQIRDTYPNSSNTIQWSEDRCPYVGAPGSMPVDWCWWRCWTFFSERWARMTMLCNGWWDQEDSPETMFYEWLIQHLDGSFPEFLKLPLVLWVRHPSRIVFAHWIHGRQLRTPWQTKMPSSLTDRSDDPEINNMRIESVTTNRLKHNYKNDRYPAILEDLWKVLLSKDVFNPESAPEDVAKSVLTRLEGPARAVEIPLSGRKAEVDFDNEAFEDALGDDMYDEGIEPDGLEDGDSDDEDDDGEQGQGDEGQDLEAEQDE